MQTTPSAINGFTAPATGGKASSRDEDRQNEPAGFESSLRSAMPKKHASQMSAKRAEESDQAKTSGAAMAINTTEATDMSETSAAADDSKSIGKPAPNREQMPTLTMSENSKKPLGTSATALVLAGTGNIEPTSDTAKAKVGDAQVSITKQANIASAVPENLTTELPDFKRTKIDEPSNENETAIAQETSAREELETDTRLRSNNPARELRDQFDKHTTAPTNRDSADSPPLRSSNAQNTGNSITGAANAAQVSTELSDPVPTADSAVRASEQKPGDPKPAINAANSTTGAATTGAATTGVPSTSHAGTELTDPLPASSSSSNSGSSSGSGSGSAVAPGDQKAGDPKAAISASVGAVPASPNTSSQPSTGQSIETSAIASAASQATSARTEPKTAVAGQAPGRPASAKAGTPALTASSQEKSQASSLTSGSAKPAAQETGKHPAKALATGHHKSRSGAKTTSKAAEAIGGKAKPDSLVAAKSETHALKQTAAASASIAEVGVDRVALAGTNASSKSIVRGPELAASMTSLPDIDAPLDPANVSEAFQGQLGERLIMAVRNDMTRAEIRINPNELGPITIDLLIDGNTAAVNFGAENSSTRNALQESLPSLRDQLAREGLSLGESSVGGQQNRSSDQNDREQQMAEWTEFRSDTTEQADEHILPDSYRPAQPAQGLVDLFA